MTTATLNGKADLGRRVAGFATQSPAEKLAAKVGKTVRGKRKRWEAKVVCRLREYRVKLGLTQVQVADAVNTHGTTYCFWENGVVTPHLHTAYKLATFFGCAVQDLWPVPAEAKG